MAGITANIVYSDRYDPWYNLALEELLLRRVRPGQVILYLWQNADTVVIGRNQNAWRECRCAALEDDGGKLARRLSGGGAVFHDLGNLNFTFVADRRLYDLKRQLQVILQAVRSLGVGAEFSGRNDLVASGRKFSGNAFYLDSAAAFHHGTVLVNTDFSRLGQYLQVSKAKMAAKGVSSVQARVTNLTEFNPAISVDAVKRSIAASFVKLYGHFGGELAVDQADQQLSDLYAKYSAWDWRYGKTPKFDASFSTRFAWGEVELALSLREGRIHQAKLFSDAMDADLIEAAGKALTDVIFSPEAMGKAMRALRGGMSGGEIVEDLRSWIDGLEI